LKVLNNELLTDFETDAPGLINLVARAFPPVLWPKGPGDEDEVIRLQHWSKNSKFGKQ